MFEGNQLNYLNICMLIFVHVYEHADMCVLIEACVYVFSMHIDILRHMFVYQY